MALADPQVVNVLRRVPKNFRIGVPRDLNNLCIRSVSPRHARRDLFRGAEPVALSQRAVALLRTLIERAGTHVSKDTLMEAAWPGLAVEDSNLTVQIVA